MVLLFYFRGMAGESIQYQFPILPISGFSFLPENRCVDKKAHGKWRNIWRISIVMCKTQLIDICKPFECIVKGGKRGRRERLQHNLTLRPVER